MVACVFYVKFMICYVKCASIKLDFVFKLRYTEILESNNSTIFDPIFFDHLFSLSRFPFLKYRIVYCWKNDENTISLQECAYEETTYPKNGK